MTNSKKDSNTEEYKGFKIHGKSVCTGYCPFHNPSDHPLKDAEIYIRTDKDMLVERICEHGIGHDDPDSVAYFHSKGKMWAGVHGCDGCCTTASKDSELESLIIDYRIKCDMALSERDDGFYTQQEYENAIRTRMDMTIQAIKSNYITKEESDRRVLEARMNELEMLEGCPPILVDGTIKDRIAELRKLLKGDEDE